MMKIPKTFVGWTNIKWLVKELIATCSDKPSYFSKKRIQAWVLFDTAVGCMIWWFCEHHKAMTYGEIIAFASVLLAAAGYQVSTIQKEKREIRQQEEDDKEMV